MTRINLFRSSLTRSTPEKADSVAWGKINFIKNMFDAGSPLVFGALLLACSLAVGCSSGQSKNEPPAPVTSPGSTLMAQNMPPVTTTPVSTPIAPVQSATAKHRKVVRKAPATVAYADKTTGVTFQYPRSYGLKTGEAADELVSSDPIPMDFVQPGGVVLTAVSLPESAYSNSDLASAFFNVSVNKSLTADQCGEFSVPQANPSSPSDTAVQATAQVAAPPISKLMIGDMELQSTETSTGGETSNGPREQASKYFHVFENGACYEFAMKVATKGTPSTTESTVKHNDREEVFHRLEKILATVKINPVTAPEVNAEAKTETRSMETSATNTSSTPAGNPAQ
jgi:Cu/Zn superoxide dismutase